MKEKSIEIEITELVNEEVAETPAREPMALEPGKKYRGSFWINEFGQFHCSPEQKGKNPTGMKLVSEGRFHKMFTTKNTVRIVFTLEKADHDTLSRNFTQAVSSAMAQMLMYNLKVSK